MAQEERAEGDAMPGAAVTGVTRAGRKSRRQTSPSIRSLVAPFLAAERRRLVLLSMSSALGGFAEAVVLVVIARVAFALVGKNSKTHFSIGPVDVRLNLGIVIAFAGALVLVRLALNIWQAHLSSSMTTNVVSETRKRIVRLYLRAEWSLQASEREGRLQELLTTYVNSAATTSTGIAQGLVSLFNLVALVATALVVNAVAAIGVAVAAAAIGALLRPLRTAVRSRSRSAANANLEFATALTELAATMQEVRIFGAEDAVRHGLDARVDETAVHQQRTRFLSTLVPALYQGVALLLLVGSLGLVYAAGVSSLVSLGAVILIMLRSLTYGQALQTAIQALHESVPYFETLRDEEKRYQAAGLPRGGEPVDAIGDLVFEHVWFEYVPGCTVLRDVSFQVPRGEIVGIVGPTGAGKSTLVQLLLRLREPTSGRVMVDGRDAREFDLDDWYRHVAFVPQEARLLPGTVADNVRFFRESAPFAAIEQATIRAHIHDEVVGLPQGYDTPAGARGGALSGGQRQRLCIARALVEDPDLMVLDEPTSGLDGRSEALIRQTMAELAPRTTVFIIAHRLSTLSMCNRIMVVQEGTLQNFDEPERLAEANAFYRDVLHLGMMQ